MGGRCSGCRKAKEQEKVAAIDEEVAIPPEVIAKKGMFESHHCIEHQRVPCKTLSTTTTTAIARGREAGRWVYYNEQSKLSYGICLQLKFEGTTVLQFMWDDCRTEKEVYAKYLRIGGGDRGTMSQVMHISICLFLRSPDPLNDV